MTPNLTTLLKRALCVVSVALCLSATPASAQVVVEYPPPEFVATAAPVYFEGHAAYWWGNRWYYRNGAAWSMYYNEPVFLHDYRFHHAPVREFYGRGRGGGGFRRR